MIRENPESGDFRTDNVGLIVCVDILGDSTKASGHKVSIEIAIFKKPTWPSLLGLRHSQGRKGGSRRV